MNLHTRHCTVLLAAVTLSAGLSAEAGAQYSRRSPIVEAVNKTRASVVSVKVPSTRAGARDSVGTGVILDERGYIVTNRHVVGSRDTVTVRLSDGSEYYARVILADPNCDLAIVQIASRTPLKALTLAPTSDLMVGETVVAVGHPYGYTNTVSVGIISALNREITMPTGEALGGLIQTDASINPGNSGGPLLNINGELIGINVALREGAQGIAFAINAATVRDLLASRLSALNLSGAGHGIQVAEKVVAETGDRQQALVWAVHHDTPAARAGLQKGDVIKAVGQRPVTNRFDVERALWDTKPGQEVSLRVQRGEEEITVSLTLADARALRQAGESTAVARSGATAAGQGTAAHYER